MTKRKNILIIFFLSFLLIFEIILIKLDLTKNIDIVIYNFFIQFMSPVLTNFLKIITLLGDELFLVPLCLFLMFFWKEKSRGVTFAFIMFISTIFNNILKLIVRRTRPSFPHLVVENSFSFPSGHTMAICCVVGLLIYYLWKSKVGKNKKFFLSSVLLVCALLVMISRIYLGVHYFSDIIGGITASLLLFSIIYYCYYFYYKFPYFSK